MTPPQIAEIIKRNLPRQPRVDITPDAELSELGADELTYHGLAQDIYEITGRDIPTNDALRWETVADVARVLGEG